MGRRRHPSRLLHGLKVELATSRCNPIPNHDFSAVLCGASVCQQSVCGAAALSARDRADGRPILLVVWHSPQPRQRFTAERFSARLNGQSRACRVDRDVAAWRRGRSGHLCNTGARREGGPSFWPRPGCLAPASQSDERWPKLAARWHTRFVDEAPGMGTVESALALATINALGSELGELAARTLRLLAEYSRAKRRPRGLGGYARMG